MNCAADSFIYFVKLLQVVRNAVLLGRLNTERTNAAFKIHCDFLNTRKNQLKHSDTDTH
jgi:hypothetical protein